MLVGLSGKRGSGKTLLASILEERHGWEHRSFAAYLKQTVKFLFDLTPDHTDGKLKETPLEQYGGITPRKIMIDVGRFFRGFDPLFWVKNVLPPDVYHTEKSKIVVSDVRYKNEADYIKSRGGIIVRLERKPELNIYAGGMDDPSETELDSYSFDLTIPAEDNVTPEDLVKTADKIHSWAGGGK